MDVFTMDHSDLPKINHEDTVEELEPEYSQAVRAGGGGGGVRKRRGRGVTGEGGGREGGREEGRDERRRKRLNGDGRGA